MFKLAVFAAVLALAAAAPTPGGLTGVVVDHGLGPIHAPNIISHAPVHPGPVHVVAQPVAPIVHPAPIVTKTIIPSHGSSFILGGLGHGLGVGGLGHGLGVGGLGPGLGAGLGHGAGWGYGAGWAGAGWGGHGLGGGYGHGWGNGWGHGWGH